MSATPLMDTFLTDFARHAHSSSDVVLRHMLNRHKDKIEPLISKQDPEWFHKAFRQVGVTDTDDDFVIWHLINTSENFWDCWTYFFTKTLTKSKRQWFSVVAESYHDQLTEAVATLEYAASCLGTDGNDPIDAAIKKHKLFLEIGLSPKEQ